jgi:hypothetical protein
MIEFMLIAAPRTATAWCANWLTTDRTLCLHEPLQEQTYAELDQRPGPRMLGISCTVSAVFHERVNKHPARKVILHRDPAEVRESMRCLKIDGSYDFDALWRVKGMHFEWREVFENPKPIYEYLLGYPFDAERHSLLRQFNIQNDALIHALQESHASAHA